MQMKKLLPKSSNCFKWQLWKKIIFKQKYSLDVKLRGRSNSVSWLSANFPFRWRRLPQDYVTHASMIYTTISPIAKNFFDGYNLCWSVLSLFNESWKITWAFNLYFWGDDAGRVAARQCSALELARVIGDADSGRLCRPNIWCQPTFLVLTELSSIALRDEILPFWNFRFQNSNFHTLPSLISTLVDKWRNWKYLDEEVWKINDITNFILTRTLSLISV